MSQRLLCLSAFQASRRWIGIGSLALVASFSQPAAAASADLAASGFLFLPAAIAPGAHPDFAAFVLQNNGPDDLLDNAASYDFYLSRQPVFDVSTAVRFGGLHDTLRLGAGEHVVINLAGTGLAYLTIPADAAGSYYVFARAQAAGDPVSNNNVAMRAGAITVGGPAPGAPVSGDFDGDRKNDLARYWEAIGNWSVNLSAGGYAPVAAHLGGSGRQPLGEDFDGDGRTDPAVYDQATGDWTVMLSAGGYGMASLAGFGGVGFVQAAADYDGDGKADPAVYREVEGVWQVKLSGSGYATAELADFGGYGYSALAADFDGDGRADPALYLAAAGAWIIRLSGSGYTPASLAAFGGVSEQPLAGNFDGDGRADPAVYNLATGTWRIMLSAGGLYIIAEAPNFGGPGFAPAPGDFDGDRLADPAVYRPATSTWYIKLSARGYDMAIVQQ